jgi:hypothetical protein
MGHQGLRPPSFSSEWSLADPGVEGGVDEVGAEVDGDVGETDAEQAALHKGVVTIADG